MKSQLKRAGVWAGILLGSMVLLGLLSSCDDDRYDYTPPAGMGALIIGLYRRGTNQ